MSKYVAYIGSYTDTNDCRGITVFDMDVEHGTMTKRCEYACSNASYLSVSHDRRFMYAITDLGIISYRIEPDGSLSRIREEPTPIHGMRGNHICLTKENDFMFVSGYYDGKITVLRINPDGSAGHITDSVFHQGPGSVAERNYRPHCRCARLTPDEKYVIVADSGIDQMKIYSFDHTTGKIRHYDTIHCRQQAGPRFIRFSSDGRFFYSLNELVSQIAVYSYQMTDRGAQYTLIGEYSTLGEKFSEYSASVSFKFANSEKNLLVTNAGDNSVCIFRRDEETGLLEQKQVLPVSGSYPTSVGIFPDNRHLFFTNHDSNSITLFSVNLETGLILMNTAPLEIPQPNCSVVVPVQE